MAHGLSSRDPELTAIREQAAQWVVQLQDADERERQRLHADCEAWQAADPRHRRVMRQMQQMWRAVNPQRERRRKGRRVAHLSVALLAVLALGQLPWAYWNADYRSVAGEIRRITLPDGSEVVLNSNSAINLAYDAQSRRVELVRGELLADVASQPARPFQVATGHATATALGTRYTVRVEAGATTVSVQESRVAVAPRRGGNQHKLAAGQRASLNDTHILDTGQVSTATPDWVQQRLVFRDVPLRQVVRRLNRHRSGVITMAAALDRHELHFTGALPADDSDAALTTLAAALDLRIARFTPWLVRLEAP